ncbi:MAG: hypothetical protein HY731_05415 [Candidatus Tectomicrobia bacterium]|nr:hypothetical protein [Candidatus Tectomicrobia bacterium]
MYIQKPKVIVILGIMGAIPVAGVAWQVLHYLLGFRRLGYDVHYVEATGIWPYGASSDDCTFPVEYIGKTMKAFGLDGKWAYCAAHSDGRCYGLSEGAITSLYERADAIINLTGATVLSDQQKVCKKLIYLETDPVIPQVNIALEDQFTREFLSAHSLHFTFGENLGKVDCLVPVQLFDYKTTRPPIVLELWEGGSRIKGEKLTTIANWKQVGKDIVYLGEIYYWSKHREFLKVIELPRLTKEKIELALAIDDPEGEQLLNAHGWLIENALKKSEDLFTYREYIWHSKGEFTVAKDQNVRLKSGWFSDRSACYLASGKPVITQETGFSKFLPIGEGLFAFQTLDDILQALDCIESNYERHSRAAKEIAEEYFHSDKVLKEFAQTAGL